MKKDFTAHLSAQDDYINISMWKGLGGGGSRGRLWRVCVAAEKQGEVFGEMLDIVSKANGRPTTTTRKR